MQFPRPDYNWSYYEVVAWYHRIGRTKLSCVRITTKYYSTIEDRIWETIAAQERCFVAQAKRTFKIARTYAYEIRRRRIVYKPINPGSDVDSLQRLEPGKRKR